MSSPSRVFLFVYMITSIPDFASPIYIFVDDFYQRWNYFNTPVISISGGIITHFDGIRLPHGHACRRSFRDDISLIEIFASIYHHYIILLAAKRFRYFRLLIDDAANILSAMAGVMSLTRRRAAHLIC